MPNQRRSNLLRRRRRLEEEGEDEGSINGPLDDSQSEGSPPSDDDGDADDSDLSETDAPESLAPTNGAAKGPVPQNPAATITPTQSGEPAFPVTEDTNVMLNGLQNSQHSAGVEALDYETAGEPEASKASSQGGQMNDDNGRQETIAEKKRREHEEYKQRRDQDPAFIPNRGAFFMHDHRSAAPGQNGFRPFGRNTRGRGGRNGIGGPFSPATLTSQATDATNNPWAHDLHDTLQEPQGRHGGHGQPPTSAPSRPVVVPQATAGAAEAPPVRQFSTIQDRGHMKLHVRLPGMGDAITYDNTLIRQYTKLPDHRPPLRRDKPVRVSLPDKSPRYVFPAAERSFIFIPRALRPNQQGFGRGSRSRLGGSLGGYSSRRTSVYGGSVYSPSIPMSRRSSLAREYNRDGMVSPSGSVRPVVRLPPGSQQHSAGGTPIHMMSGHGTPVMNLAPPHGYALPQKPTFRENWPANMPMHQPRPQKTVSVAGIESPAYNAAPQEHLPFQHQLPPHVNGSNAAADFYPRQQPYPTQTSSGTPLSNIPERAIHAPAFQPFQQATYQPAAPTYYYPTSQPQYPSGAVLAPMLMQNSGQTYLVPAIAPAMPQSTVPAISNAPQSTLPASQPGMVAYEQNGMVYYCDPNQMNQMYVPAEGYAPTGNYSMSGMGGMMTPPDGFYYPQVPAGTIYYPQQ